MNNLKLEPFNINKSYKGLNNFDCGNEMINKFIKKNLKKRVKKNLSRAYVLIDKEERIIAFYTLDSFSITKDNFNNIDKPSMPPLVPIIKLGMLGVDKKYQGKGLGKRILKNAIMKTLEASKIIGCVGLYLLAEKDAIKFYEKLGFIKLKNEIPTPMFLSIKTIKDALINTHTTNPASFKKGEGR